MTKLAKGSLAGICGEEHRTSDINCNLIPEDMEHNEIVTVPSHKKTITRFVTPCLKCGNDDIKIEEYEDRYGPISTATCKNKSCKNEVKENSFLASIIKLWNKQNDIDTLVADKKALIESTKAEIKDLIIKQRLMKKAKPVIKTT